MTRPTHTVDLVPADEIGTLRHWSFWLGSAATGAGWGIGGLVLWLAGVPFDARAVAVSGFLTAIIALLIRGRR